MRLTDVESLTGHAGLKDDDNDSDLEHDEKELLGVKSTEKEKPKPGKTT